MQLSRYWRGTGLRPGLVSDVLTLKRGSIVCWTCDDHDNSRPQASPQHLERLSTVSSNCYNFPSDGDNVRHHNTEHDFPLQVSVRNLLSSREKIDSHLAL